MKITTSHSMIKLIFKDTIFFYVLLLSWSNNYFEYDTVYNSFILGFCWNLLALAIIYNNGK